MAAQSSNISITPGLLIPRKDVLNAPPVKSPSAATASTYTAFMVDPAGPFLHWFQPNLVRTSSSNSILDITLMTDDSRILAGARYLYPLPPAGDPAHSYVVLLFEQPANWHVPEKFSTIGPLSSQADRFGFDIADFVSVPGLDGMIAGANYFKVSAKTVCTSGKATTCDAPIATKTGGNAMPTTSSSSANSRFEGLSWLKLML